MKHELILSHSLPGAWVVSLKEIQKALIFAEDVELYPNFLQDWRYS